MDGQTGEIIETADIAQEKSIKSKYKKEKLTKEERDKRTAIFENDMLSIKLNYKRSDNVGSGMSKRNKSAIKVSCIEKLTGSVKWETSIQGFFAHSLCNNVFGWTSEYDFGGDFIWVNLVGDKVFVIYEGLAVLNLEDGKLLWQVDNKITDIDFKLMALDQQIGTSAFPQVDREKKLLWWTSKTDDYNGIVCYDLETGAVKWQSKSFNKEAIFPVFLLQDNALVVQKGGQVLTQRYVPGSGGNPDVCNQEIKVDNNAGIMAFDYTTGNLLWNSDDLKKSWGESFGKMANTTLWNGNIVATSDKNILTIDLSGNIKQRIPIKSLKTGETKNLNSMGGNIYFYGTEGMAAFNPDEGNVIWSANTKANYGNQKIGDAFFIYTSVSKYSGRGDAFVRIDLNTGEIPGKIEDVPYPYFTSDGNYFFAYEKGTVTKYRTK
jgi:outer membrane protein assembly factor BamB